MPSHLAMNFFFIFFLFNGVKKNAHTLSFDVLNVSVCVCIYESVSLSHSNRVPKNPVYSSEKVLFLNKRQIIFRILYILLFMLCINTIFRLFYSPFRVFSFHFSFHSV